MKAVRLHGPERTLSFDEIEDPAPVLPEDVVVRISASGLCRTDLHTIDSLELGHLESLGPFVMGHENAGIVYSAGERVSDLRRGDRVLLHPFWTCGRCIACRSGNDMRCEVSRFPGVDGTDGGMSDFMLTKRRSVVKLSGSSGLSVMAPLADAGNTAYHAIKQALPWLVPGSNVLILGVGGLGHIALQLLKKMSLCTVFAADVSENGLHLAEQLGADHVLDVRRGSFLKDLMNASKQHGMNVILDFVGEGEAPHHAISSAAIGALYTIVGYGGKITADTLTIMEKDMTVRGSVGGNYNDLVELSQAVERGFIKPMVKEYRLSQFDRAIDDLRRHEIPGRAVLIP